MNPPPLPDPTIRDREHLNLLGIFHFVFGGLALLGIAFLVMHYMLFQTVMSSAARSDPSFPGEIFSAMIWFYAFMGIIMFAAGIINVYAGICLRRQTNHMFTIVVSALNCLSIPLGTTLGIFTIIVLQRESVKHLYNRG